MRDTAEYLRSKPTEPQVSAELVENIRILSEIIESAPELNPSNYDHEQVCELNAKMVEAYLFLRDTILSELDRKPVDPDLVLAREIACEKLNELGASAEQIAAGDIAAGERDDAIVVHVALAAIKRTREEICETGGDA